MFPDCEPLLAFAVSLKDLHPTDPKFLEALTKDMDSDERVEQLRARDPAVLAGLVHTFPGVEMERLHANMKASDLDKFWPALHSLVTTTMVQQPMEMAFPDMEQRTREAFESAQHMNIDTEDKAQLAGHVFSRVMADHDLSNMEQMAAMLQDPAKLAPLQRFLKLNNADVDIGRLMRAEGSEQEIRDAMRAVSGIRLPMEGLAGVNLPAAMEEMKQRLGMGNLEEIFAASFASPEPVE